VIYGKESWQANGGNDVLKGLGGSDTIYANSGNDTVDGGTGDDLLNSGFGNDVFYFGQNSGYDTIKDFGRSSGNQDKIVIDGEYKGYFKEFATNYVVLKLDHNGDGFTDAHVKLSGVYANEWESLRESAIVTNSKSSTYILANEQLHLWDQANANFFGV
jgi:Ca2+-binding RTX toxin-like protein